METFKEPFINEIKLAKIKRLPNGGLWEAGILSLPALICCKDNMDKDGYPGIFVAARVAEKILIRTKPFSNFPLETDDAMENFMDAILEYGMCPQKIHVPSKDAKLFLNKFCEKLDISLEMARDVKSLSWAISTKYPFSDSRNEVALDTELEDLEDELEIINVDCEADNEPYDITKEFDNELDKDQAKRIIAFLDVVPNHQLIGLPFINRLDFILHLNTDIIPKKLYDEKVNLLRTTFNCNDNETHEVAYKFHITLDSKRHFDLKMNGAENLMCFSIFLRSLFHLDTGSYHDIIHLSDDKQFCLSNMSDAVRSISNIGLEVGSSFMYQMKGRETTSSIQCKVLSARNTKNIVKYPSISKIVGIF